MNLIKAHGGKGSWTFSFEIGHLSSTSRSCLGRFILICGGQGALWAEPHPPLDLITEFGKTAAYKVNTQKSKAFLYTNNDTSETEVRKNIPFDIATRK